MIFEPIYYGDKIHVVNKSGDVGIITLWSPVKQVVKMLGEIGVDVSPQTSRVAVVANLYGNGFPQLLRNLLWNPQVTRLLVMGQNLSGSREEVVAFFKDGLELVDYLGSPAHRIKGTQRIIDGLVTPELFQNGIKVTALGNISDPATKEDTLAFFQSLQPPSLLWSERRNIPIPKTETRRFPSEPRQHSILSESPLEAWKSLIFRLMRFGYMVTLKKGKRVELQNVKVVITHPRQESATELQEHGFSLSQFQEYQKQILSPQLSEQSYTYGNRIRGYYVYQGDIVDSLAIVVKRLQEDRETRHGYVSLWDNSRDLPEGHNCPCLASLFFRYFDTKLTLTATFRTHNAMDAWLENVYGIMAIQKYVADQVAIEPGAITILSHSISVSDDALARATQVAASVALERTKATEPTFDPYGNFAVTVDKQTNKIVVQHTYQGAVIAEYRGATAEQIERQLERDEAVSNIAHALYLGREIARHERLLR